MNDLWFELTRVRADVVLTLGFILAVAATIHIVLTKREVTSAVGWIGLMWFAPFMGVLTYLVLGINRVKRRARLDRRHGEELGDRPVIFRDRHPFAGGEAVDQVRQVGLRVLKADRGHLGVSGGL